MYDAVGARPGHVWPTGLRLSHYLKLPLALPAGSDLSAAESQALFASMLEGRENFQHGAIVKLLSHGVRQFVDVRPCLDSAPISVRLWAAPHGVGSILLTDARDLAATRAAVRARYRLDEPIAYLLTAGPDLLGDDVFLPLLHDIWRDGHTRRYVVLAHLTDADPMYALRQSLTRAVEPRPAARLRALLTDAELEPWWSRPTSSWRYLSHGNRPGGGIPDFCWTGVHGLPPSQEPEPLPGLRHVRC